jgi:hypothetical protein
LSWKAILKILANTDFRRVSYGDIVLKGVEQHGCPVSIAARSQSRITTICTSGEESDLARPLNNIFENSIVVRGLVLILVPRKRLNSIRTVRSDEGVWLDECTTGI